MDRFPVDEIPRIRLVVSGHEIIPSPIGKWERLNVGRGLRFRAYLTLSPDALRAVGEAKTLAIDDDFPRVHSDLSMKTNLSTQNLASGISLFLRSLVP
jgi:hypothetical protein